MVVVEEVEVEVVVEEAEVCELSPYMTLIICNFVMLTWLWIISNKNTKSQRLHI